MTIYLLISCCDRLTFYVICTSNRRMNCKSIKLFSSIHRNLYDWRFDYNLQLFSYHSSRSLSIIKFQPRNDEAADDDDGGNEEEFRRPTLELIVAAPRHTIRVFFTAHSLVVSSGGKQTGRQPGISNGDQQRQRRRRYQRSGEVKPDSNQVGLFLLTR